jgi:5-formyltetrahydrofolate cyclo-ligase
LPDNFLVTQTKTDLRTDALSRRMQMPQAERAQASAEIARKIIEYLPLQAQTVIAGYWPIKAEVDVMYALKEMIRTGHRTALPVIVDFKQPLAFRLWTEKSPMTEGRYGIHQPDAARCGPAVPDVILVPMLAFDARCQRLGYGSGFYDRTFDHLRALHHVTAVGVAFESQKVDEVPTGPLDYPMDVIITERNTYHPERPRV